MTERDVIATAREVTEIIKADILPKAYRLVEAFKEAFAPVAQSLKQIEQDGPYPMTRRRNETDNINSYSTHSARTTSKEKKTGTHYKQDDKHL